MKKLNIELTAYEALTLLKFLTEFKKEMEGIKKLTHLKNCVETFESEVKKKIPLDVMDEVIAELTVNQEFGLEPS